MAFKKGQPKPEGSGRTKGTPNRNSLRILDDLEAADINLIAEFKREVKAVEDPEKRMEYWKWLIDRAYPRLKELDPLDLLKDIGADIPRAAATPPPVLPAPSAGPMANMSPKEILATFMQVAARSDGDG